MPRKNSIHEYYEEKLLAVYTANIALRQYQRLKRNRKDYVYGNGDYSIS